MTDRVNINPVSSLFPSIIPQNSNTIANNAGNSNSVSSAAAQTDASGISPSASFLSELQELQQQNPGQFSHLVSQIAGKLQTAAQQASASGNTTKAHQLTTLATEFENSASGGAIPTPQQLQQSGLGGYHHHGGHHHGGGTNPASAFQTTSSDTDVQNLLGSLQI
jgi:hypothetical protein